MEGSKLDQETYISILGNRFYPWFTNVMVHQGRDFIFQEDGASCYTYSYARWWKETHQTRGFEYWSAQSPNLSPIKHVWNILGGYLVKTFKILKISGLWKGHIIGSLIVMKFFLFNEIQ
ncbi:hypothetical protein RO3G_16625 [Rhizopus delemar RA 99-880]|uniref:Tc1-like transposase DDE domain-containing protein n=1 Tax=Rhizopus delemar (strain RA 99-880 / ATCC MYA-4621 / FGSC 9543 / NRRL 43880) TaxID=246409 RepID=I1CTY4_RHIO9|nr:hypothetical protein RO3G_16625 [Rhizopus delemar RA 99-880]|eukprot:EIE91914.1 hypothetical protein RO3G_16625 [Rhizopus delemar RA 99-880]